jgi:pimeloyl-ACP methyl ester carboxylesterase
MSSAIRAMRAVPYEPVPKLITSTALPGAPWKHRVAGDDYGATAQPDWREIDWRGHLHRLEIDGRTVNYVGYGEGSPDKHPVVLVHGLGGSWQNWLENIPRMAAEGRRVIALDLPGHGFSEMPREQISIAGYGATVNALCDELDLGEVVLVGNSMGGFVSAETAIQFPDRVERLVLISAAGITTSDVTRAPLMAASRVFALVAALAAARSETLVARPRLRIPMFAQIIRYPRRIRADLLHEITYSSGRKGFTHALGAILGYDFRDRLTEISCPTLIIWGKHDMLVPDKDADEYERLIPNSRKVVLNETGHMAMLERPPTVNDLLVEFADEVHERPAREEELGGGANVRGPLGGSGGSGSGNGATGAERAGAQPDAV